MVDRGYGVLADGQELVTAISNGSWVAGGLEAFSFAPADGPDPRGRLDAAGLGWLDEYLAPLPAWLDDLAADEASVHAFSQDWAGVARGMSAAATAVDEAVTAELSQEQGDAADAYRSLSADVSAHLEGTADWAEGISAGVQTAVTVQQAVRGTVREALEDVVDSVLEQHGLGVDGPALVDHTAAMTAHAAQDVGASVNALLTSLRDLGGLMEELAEVLARAQGLFDSVPAHGRRAFRDTTGPGHTPLPEVGDVAHPRDGGDVNTWANTVAARHGTLSAGEVAEVYQFTQTTSTGQTSATGQTGSTESAPAVTATVAQLAALPPADLRTVHTTALPEAEAVRMGQQLPAALLDTADDGNAQVHVDWLPRTETSSLSHYRDEPGYCGGYLEVVGRQWNPAQERWEIFARQL
ncbi:MAG: hypothetical protein FWF21_00285 [Micrococcales bacterium]|nr:hypothetical protein [Micrococcales bacterium]